MKRMGVFSPSFSEAVHVKLVLSPTKFCWNPAGKPSESLELLSGGRFQLRVQGLPAVAARLFRFLFLIPLGTEPVLLNCWIYWH